MNTLMRIRSLFIAMNITNDRMVLVAAFLSFASMFFSPSISLSDDTDYAEALVEKAKLQYLWKNYEEALNTSLKVLTKDSKNIDALILCAQSGYNLKKYDKAKTCFESIFENYPEKRDEFSKDYGVVLYKSQKIDEAEKYLRRALELDREDELAGYYLSEILLKSNREREAESNLKTIFERRGEMSIPAGVLLSDIYISRGDNGSAQEILKALEKERMSELSSQIISGLSQRISPKREFYKKLFIDFSLGVGFDTNSTYVTDIENDSENQRESAFSQLSIDIVYNPIVDARKRLYLELYLLKSFNYEDIAKQFDKLVLNPRLGYRFFMDERRKTQIDLGYEYYNNFFSGGERVGFKDFDSFFQSNGLYAEVNYKFEKITTLLRYDFSFVEYDDHNRSAFDNRIMLSFSIPLLKTGNVFAASTLGLNDARLNLYDYRSVGANIGFQIPLIESLWLFGIVGYEYRDFFDNSSNRGDSIITIATKIEYVFSKRYFVNITGSYFNQDSSLRQYSLDKGMMSLNVGFYY